MYYIISTDLGDDTVKLAFETIVNNRQHVLNSPGRNFTLITENNSVTYGDGGANQSTMVIIGHGSPNGVSDNATWRQYMSTLSQMPAVAPQSIWVVACSTAGEGSLFAYGNFATSVKWFYNNSTVWASKTAVNARDLSGTWEQV